LYENPIVVCDVSAKNANVMFELGMRLAFDKPTVIIKDDKTGYSFDTSVIEHLNYPRDLRYQTIVEFKDQLAEKIKSTAKSAQTGASFLKQFGSYKLAQIDEKTVSISDAVLQEVRDLRDVVVSMNRTAAPFLDARSDTHITNLIRQYRRGNMGQPISSQYDEILKYVEQELNATSRFSSKGAFTRAFDNAFERYRSKIRARPAPTSE
jgi:hypothetical protein